MIRTLKLHEQFVHGFLAEGFAHRFKVEKGLPIDARILGVTHIPKSKVVEIQVESNMWMPGDDGMDIDLVIHELPQ
jgi:hypothetical protein